MAKHTHYDAIIIGAGMSGLAAGIRLAMYDKKVCILEKHSISGGLNSYYKRGKREFDVGLHALTNYRPRGEKGPLSKLLKQLRIPYEAFKLSEQSFSEVVFPDHSLKFNNNIGVFIEEIQNKFPQEIDGFLKLLEHIKNYNEVALTNETFMAKPVVSSFIKNKELVEMIFCPLLIYGSAWENDMDFSQFVIMFKSIFLEGFSRPEGGVRTIINILLEKFQSLGGELLFKHEVECIQANDQEITKIKLKNELELTATHYFSSMGLPETMKIISGNHNTNHNIGRLSFTESIFVFDKTPKQLGLDATILFYNNRPEYKYQESKTLYDSESAVICMPNNFIHDDYKESTGEGWIRLTHIANFGLWKKLERTQYLEEKEKVAESGMNIIKKIIPNFNAELKFKDVFTPTTIERYTGHFQGTVYGSTDKSRDGRTPYKNLYIIGTDQGFLGIVGSMLSGISMANLYGLMDGLKTES